MKKQSDGKFNQKDLKHSDRTILKETPNIKNSLVNPHRDFARLFLVI